MTKIQTTYIKNANDDPSRLNRWEGLLIKNLSGHSIDYKLTDLENETLVKISRKYATNIDLW